MVLKVRITEDDQLFNWQLVFSHSGAVVPDACSVAVAEEKISSRCLQDRKAKSRP